MAENTPKSFLGVRIETPVGLIDNNTEKEIELADLSTDTISGTGQRWDVSFQATDALGADRLAAKVSAHQSRNGRRLAFDFPVLQMPNTPDVSFIGTVDVESPVAAGLDEVEVRTSVGTVTLPESYFFVFNTGKVYQVVNEGGLTITTSSGSLKIYPTLRTDLTTAGRMVLSPTMRVKWGSRDSTYATRIERGVELRTIYNVKEAV